MAIDPKIDPSKLRIAATRQVAATFHPERQTADDIRKVLDLALGKAGCLTCGRLHRLIVEFDPDPIDKTIQTGIPSIATITQQGF